MSNDEVSPVLLRQEFGRDVGALAPATGVGQDQAPARRPAHLSVERHVVQVEHSLHGPGQARRAVADCTARFGLQDAADDLLLVVSEMVTNAVRHGAPPVRLEVSVDDDAVVVCVADGSASLPRARSTCDDEDEGGRGMVLVELLASAHGVLTSPPGKTVWAALRRPAAPPSPQGRPDRHVRGAASP